MKTVINPPLTDAGRVKILLDRSRALLAYANRYSDEMTKIGRGAEELGSNVDSVSVAGMMAAAIELCSRPTSPADTMAPRF